MMPYEQAEFRRRLIESNYAPYKRSLDSAKILGEACLESIQERRGAIFYADFLDPLGQRIYQLIKEKRINPKSRLDHLEWRVEDFRRNLIASHKREYEDEGLSSGKDPEAEIVNIRHSLLVGLAKDIAVNQLSKVAKDGKYGFQVRMIYHLLNDFYCKNQNDSLQINLPDNLTINQLVKLKEKTRYLLLKRMVPNVEPNEEDIEKFRKRLEEDQSNGWSMRWQRESIIGGFKSALGHTSVAFTDMKKAVSFLDTYLSTKPQVGKSFILTGLI